MPRDLPETLPRLAIDRPEHHGMTFRFRVRRTLGAVLSDKASCGTDRASHEFVSTYHYPRTEVADVNAGAVHHISNLEIVEAL